jgi:hypothetical protein
MNLLFALLLVLLPQQPVKGNVAITIMATDAGCGVDYVQVFNGSNPISPKITTPAPDGSYSFTFDTKTLTNGSYNITAKAADKAGPDMCDGTTPNIGVSPPATIVVGNPDITAPTVTITITIKVGP